MPGFQTMLMTAQIVSLILGGIGTSANAAVLALLVRARRALGGGVSYMIANQCVMDFCSRYSVRTTKRN